MLNRNSVSTVSITLVFGTTLVLSVLASSQSSSSAPAAGAPARRTAGQAYKNVQVLKDVPSDELVPAMQFVAASLGVNCNYCHVQGQFDKDEKQNKQTARRMMQMQLSINRDNYSGEHKVTCYSCHRGATEAVAVPVISEGESRPDNVRGQKKVESALLPTADQIIAKYIQSLGGAAAIQKVSTRLQKCTVSIGGRTLTSELSAKAPNQWLSVTHTPNGDIVLAYDGHSGWRGNSGQPTVEMSPADLELLKLESDMYLPIHLNQIFTQLQVRPTEKIGDHPADVVVGTRNGQPPVWFYFDQESHLLVRMVRFVISPLGDSPLRIDYSDYRSEDGIKIPFRWTTAQPQQQFTTQVEHVEQNVSIEDSKFSRPATLERTSAK